MAVDKATALVLEPAYSSVPDDKWALAFRFQALVITEGDWSDHYEQAALLYVLHWLTVAGGAGGVGSAGGGGPIQSMSVGQVSVTYAVPQQQSQSGTAGLSATKWGRLLLALREQLGVHFFVA